MVFIDSARKMLIYCGLLLGLFSFTRLWNLLAIPIFTDEAIYLRWSQIGSRDLQWIFISLTDGKQPMFTWLTMLMLQIIPDPLLAGRLVSVFAGSFTLFAMNMLSYELFKNLKLSVIVSLMYIFSPFSLMYDKLALYDSLVCTFYIWSLYFAVLLVKHLRFSHAILYGLILGFGMLNKSSGFLSLYLVPTTLVLFNWQKAIKNKKIIRWIVLVFIAAVVSQIMYNVQRFSPFFHMISLKENVFIYGFREWVSNPFIGFIGNFRGMLDWTITYLTWPIFLSSFVSFAWTKHALREKFLLFCWSVLPFLALAMFAKVLYPRFILFMAMPLLMLSAYTIERIVTNYTKTLFGVFVLMAILFPSIRSSFYLITNPIFAPIPFADRGQFIDDWPSGWGINEIVSYVKDKSESGKVSVYTEGTFGLLPFALELYLHNQPNVFIQGLWPVPNKMTPEIIDNARDHPSYLVLNVSTSAPNDWSVELIQEFMKGKNPDAKLRLYEIYVND